MIDSLDETELIKRISDGDRKAFAQLYSQYINSLHRYIYLFTKSKYVTDEILQNVFIKIWERRQTLDQITSFKAYVYRSAKNMLMDEIRRKNVHAKVFLAVTPTSEESQEKTDSKIIYNEYLQIAQSAMDLLPEKRKKIVQMRIQEEMTLDEIADKLSISKNVVKKQLYAGMLFIKAYLQKNAEISNILILIYFIDLN
jgi:RNA polymerase sigma-70 factor (family 1)